MLGSAAFRTGVAPGGALAGPWVRNSLWTRARAVPSLDLRFADNKSLVDAVTGAQLVTFTRASRGTYVGSDGVVMAAVTNLLLRSEEFQTTWSPLNVTVSTDTSISPTGSLTADTITPAASTAAHLISQTATVVASTPCTASVYIKNDGAPFVQVVYDNGASVGAFINVNTSTGAITRGPELAGVATNATGSVVSVGNGWYRVNVGATHTGTIGRILISPLPAASSAASVNPSTTTAATDKVLLWGAQLEQSSTVGEYIPTTSVINSAPRFDHNPTTGESLGLLVEEARTNLLTYSEDVSQWATPFNTTLTANSITAPDNALTADRLLETTATNLHTCDGTALTFATSTVYTYSVFVKPIGDRNFEIAFPVTLFTARFARFTLSGTGSVQGVDSGVTASIQALANGWYRCSATSTCAAGAGSRIGNFINDASNSRSYTGDITKGIYIWGAQLEAGAFATSYIPTTTATVTRAADVASITGSNFSSWYNQTEGTLYWEGVIDSALPSGSFGQFFDFRTDGTNRLSLYWNPTTTNNVGFFVMTGGVTQVTTQHSLGTNVQSKLSGAYKINDFASSLSGSVVQTDTSGTLPTSIVAFIGSAGAGSVLGQQRIRRLTYWPTRLATLQAITQP